MDEFDRFHVPDENDDDGLYLSLTNPCVLDCNTEIGRITLILDRQHPRFLFVQIAEEFRKCILLDSDLAVFPDDMAVYDFLHRFQETAAFNRLIAEEKNLDEGWEAL